MTNPQRPGLGTDPRLKRYESLAEMIGDPQNPTPLVALQHVLPSDDVSLYVKLEWMNPFGSVKDRPARWMLESLEERGELAGKTVLEPTSGNTGIALAAMSALLGHPMTVSVPCSVPLEKAVLLRALGATVIETSGDSDCEVHPIDEAIHVAEAMLAESDEYVIPNQYGNPDNVRSHYETTGPEIWEQTQGRIRYFFAGLGTCGTITGVGRYLKEHDPDVRVIAIEPVPGHHISGLKNLEESSVPAIFDRSFVDDVVYVDDDEAREVTLRLHREDALLVGSSGGAVIAGALRYLRGRSGVAVAIAPDSSQKAISYLAEALGH